MCILCFQYLAYHPLHICLCLCCLGAIYLNVYPTARFGSWNFLQQEKWDWGHVRVFVFIILSYNDTTHLNVCVCVCVCNVWLFFCNQFFSGHYPCQNHWEILFSYLYVLLNYFFVDFLYNYCTSFRCCCTRGTTWSNYLHRCCNEGWTH